MKECPCIDCLCVPICRNKLILDKDGTIIIISSFVHKVLDDCSLAKNFCQSGDGLSPPDGYFNVLDALLNHKSKKE